MAKKKPDLRAAAAPAPLSSMAELLRARGVEVREQTPTPPRPPVPTPSEFDLARCGKLVVRRERKGHGGKTVTVVEGLGLPNSQLEELARALRVALGCGSRVEDGRVVVQGDHAPGVETFLRQRGAGKIVIGN